MTLQRGGWMGAAANVARWRFRRRLPDENVYRRIFEQSPVGLLVLAPDQRVTLANRSFDALLGYAPEEFRGRLLWDAVHPDDSKAVGNAIQELSSGLGRGIDLEARLATKDGAWLWTGIVVSALYDERQRVRGFIVLMKDISRRKKTEQDTLRSNADLELYASIAAHDLQEPVRKVITYAQWLATMSADLPDAGKTALGKIQNAAARMRMLIEDLLEYSRISSQELSIAPVDLNVIFKEVLSDLDVQVAASRARVTVAKLPVVEANALQMRLLFQNLLSNALKFVKPGEAPSVDVAAELLEGTRVHIEVKDQGIGFDEKFMDRLFRPFQRLCDKNRYEGTGIGLAICKKVVERHGGSITAASAPGKGASFHVVLPLQRRML